MIVANSQEQMLGTLEAKGVEIWYTESENGNPWVWFGNLLPLVFLAALWYYHDSAIASENPGFGDHGKSKQ